jgi:hypothetical protein
VDSARFAAARVDPGEICELAMSNLGNNRPTFRLFTGGAMVILVWVCYVIRLTLDIGPMHDLQGNQAPTHHYLVIATMVTGMVLLWIIIRGGPRRS